MMASQVEMPVTHAEPAGSVKQCDSRVAAGGAPGDCEEHPAGHTETLPGEPIGQSEPLPGDAVGRGGTIPGETVDHNGPLPCEPVGHNEPLPGETVQRMKAEVREASPANDDSSQVKASSLEKKATKDSGKSKRREDKGIEHVLKALSSLESTEEKLAALCKKYTELLDEHRLLQNSFKQTQKKHHSLTREKDQLQNEQSKTVLAKSKLESLCRELQKHNKIIKDESVARAKEEEEKRKEVTAKFQATINDIQRQMNENYEKNNKLREENVELANKLKNLIEQYELREQHIEKVFKHKELELQLVDAKLAQANLMMTEEKEHNIREKKQMLDEACHYQQKIEILEAQEKQLRSQVALYTEKYEEFQTTLAKSNEVFQSFKSEMDKMTKKIKKLEKETTMWRSRWENSNKALIEMAEHKTRSDKDTALLNSKVHKLESLCRALQDERKKLAAKVADVESATINGVVHSEEKLKEPTKTPPNTPEGGGSRASPVTVTEGQCTTQNPQEEPATQDAKADEVVKPTAPADSQEEEQNPEQNNTESNETDQSENVTTGDADTGDK